MINLIKSLNLLNYTMENVIIGNTALLFCGTVDKNTIDKGAGYWSQVVYRCQDIEASPNIII